MQIFLDSANLESIRLYSEAGLIDGLTTNPSLIAKEGVEFEPHVRAILELIQGPVSVEVIATDFEGMMNEGRRIAQWGPNVVVKVPMTLEGLKAVRQFSKESIATNVTLVFSSAQALLAANAGATYMSPFLGRLDDVGEDGLGLLAEIAQLYAAQGFDTTILAASLRHPRHVVEAAKLGAGAATLPVAVLEKLIHHPLTDRGLEQFLTDWANQRAPQSIAPSSSKRIPHDSSRS